MMKYTTIRRGIALGLAACLLLSSLSACGGASAAGMQLVRTEGAVDVADGKGKPVQTRDGLSLQSGYAVGTGAESFAWIGLDETKLAELDEQSAVSIEKKGRKLALEVQSGRMYFNVSKPLEEDETMHIRSSSMTVGIRGTNGWVHRADENRLDVYLLSGSAECTAGTGDGAQTMTIGPWQAARMALDAEGRGTVTVEQFTAADIPAFVRAQMSREQQEGAPELQRTMFLNGAMPGEEVVPAAAVEPFAVEDGLANVINLEDFSYLLTDEARRMLAENGFVVLQSAWGGSDEFYSIYEMNRYSLTPNFVTTDAMMHTYHLYFSRLLKGVERDFFVPALTEMSRTLQAESAAQLEALSGTAWEGAARRSLAYCSVALSLLEPETAPPAAVADLVNAELALINAAQGVAPSPLMNLEESGGDPLMEDYSQYIPRGYYTTSEELSRYFRAMMWYGRLNFRQSDESQSRSALLLTAALKNSAAMEQWEKIYTVTSFFVGTSDDAGVYEYAPLIEQAYGGLDAASGAAAAQLPEREAEWQAFRQAAAALEMPAINSIPVPEGQSDAERAAAVKGFRVMGQRFVMDADIFQKLIYNAVGANSAGGQRMLPSALDVPAALGSAVAREILTQSGADDYAGYTENMAQLQTSLAAAPDTLWNASLYGGWLNTLRPLTQRKGEGWPQFMQNDAWAAKSLNTFLGSWTELKHDTVLYAKQAYAEMGGGGVEEKDDRGYVEPEPLLYARLSALCGATRDGLAAYGVLREADADALSRMAELSDSLKAISDKELTNTPRTEEEYELIRSFGGQLEHFWHESLKDETDMEYFSAQEFPSAIVADVATDPNGTVLEVGTGGVEEILVIVDVEGSLRIASGGVYSFYEFPQPIAERLTDETWRRMIGKDYAWDENGNLVDQSADVPRPAWISRFAAAPYTD